MSKSKDALKSVYELKLTTVIDVAANYGADIFKKEARTLIAELGIDLGASLVPGISGAVQSYKRRRFERNINKAIEETLNRIEKIEDNLRTKTEEQRARVNQMYQYILDFISDEPQEDKIKYFINGFVHLTDHDSITEDFVLTYYDLMSDLRMVDLAVLRLYCNNIASYDEENRETFRDVVEQYGLTADQYDSVRNNLHSLGLLTSVKDQEYMKDIKSLFESIKAIHKYLDRVSRGKRTSKLKDPKMRSKERFRISQFGRQFHDFFLEENTK